MRWEVISRRERRIGQPDSDRPVNQWHKHEVNQLIPSTAMVASIEGQLIQQVEIEPWRLHIDPLDTYEGQCRLSHC